MVQDCSRLLDQSLLMLTYLQEDSTLQQVETEAWELQQSYGKVRGTVQTVAITQRLAMMRPRVLRHKLMPLGKRN